MNYSRKITRVFKASQQIPITDSSKIVLMSDCHRGDGSWADDFAKNRNIFRAALDFYYRENYIYIELGDGDELWKNINLTDIFVTYADIYERLYQFMESGRLHLIYGNHDRVRKNANFIDAAFRRADWRTKKLLLLYKKLPVHEGLILNDTQTGERLFLLHGHQADFFNSSLWRLSRALVRHLWRPLELIGVRDPMSTAKNNAKKETVEKRLAHWAETNRRILVAGHTHRSVFPAAGQSPYFNDGCCVHPRGITGIEITGGRMSLAQWSIKTKSDGTLYVGRDIQEGPRKIGVI